uniref:Uncharacterized protein n=1 Tax=Pseudomonas phage PACT201 TaxID=3230130 RepID=A0AAU8GV04_9VIRU
MPITEQQLLQILPNAGPRAGVFCWCGLNRGDGRASVSQSPDASRRVSWPRSAMKAAS